MPQDGYALGIDIGTTGVTAAVCPVDRGAAAPSPERIGAGAPLPPVSLPWTLEPGVMDRVGDPAPLRAGDRSAPAAELVATLVARVVAAFAAAEGRPPSRVAVAVPPSWGEDCRAALTEALRDAEVGRSELVSGAVAAAHGIPGPVPDGPLVVVDLGARTLDIAVVGPGDGGVLGHRAAPSEPYPWGGRDVDDALFRHVLGFLPEAVTEPVADRAAAGALRAACVAAKEALSVETDVSVDVDGYVPGTSVRVTRAELEELVGADVDAAVDAVVEVATAGVGAARLEPGRLRGVVLVGGAVRMPLIAERLSTALAAPLVVDPDPASVLARGAAVLAAEPAHGASRHRNVAPLSAAAVAAGQGQSASGRWIRPEMRRPPSAPRAAAWRRVPLATSSVRRRSVVLVLFVGLLLGAPVALATLRTDGAVPPSGQPVARAAGERTAPDGGTDGSQADASSAATGVPAAGGAEGGTGVAQEGGLVPAGAVVDGAVEAADPAPGGNAGPPAADVPTGFSGWAAGTVTMTQAAGGAISTGPATSSGASSTTSRSPVTSPAHSWSSDPVPTTTPPVQTTTEAPPTTTPPAETTTEIPPTTTPPAETTTETPPTATTTSETVQ